jgi:XTP/dITP diphosphohydrolase
MAARAKIPIVYVTSNQYKIEENRLLVQHGTLSGGEAIADVFEFEILELPIKEVLEVDLSAMVTSEATEAYSQIKVPCIVEHAGLIFSGYEGQSYPGGLTKPMWNALGDKFISETQSADRPATAVAVVAYCDGKAVLTFRGETKGRIALSPRGGRQFYWDTVFVPDTPTGKSGSKTYAEIVDDPTLGLKYKVRELSQSSKAMVKFLEYRRKADPPELWAR